jgi:hypothetical protein
LVRGSIAVDFFHGREDPCAEASPSYDRDIRLEVEDHATFDVLDGILDKDSPGPDDSLHGEDTCLAGEGHSGIHKEDSYGEMGRPCADFRVLHVATCDLEKRWLVDQKLVVDSGSYLRGDYRRDPSCDQPARQEEWAPTWNLRVEMPFHFCLRREVGDHAMAYH